MTDRDELARRLLEEFEDVNAAIRERLPVSPFTSEEEFRIEQIVYRAIFRARYRHPATLEFDVDDGHA